MRRGIFFILWIVLLYVGYNGAEGLCKTKGAPRLNVPESFHSFGQIYRGEKVSHRFLLRNEGEAELEIQKVRASCGCTAAAPSQKVVPPGGEAYVEVTFDSRNFLGKITKTVTVSTNDPLEPVHTLTLEAHILEEVVAEPSRLVLGQIKQGEGRDLKIEIKSPIGSDFKVSGAQSSSKALGVTSIERQADGMYTLRLEVKKDSPTGRFGGDLVVYTSSQRQPVITIPFFGEVVGDVSVFPPQLSFGLVRRGSEVMRQVLVTIHNPEVRLAGAKVEPAPGGYFSLHGEPESGRGFYRVNIALNREAPIGRLEGSLKIYTTSSSQPLITVPISATIKE